MGTLFLVENIALAFHTTTKIPQTFAPIALFSLSITCALVFWLHYDSRLTHTSLGLDQAMYIFFAWPIIFPLYLYKTRGFLRTSLLLLILIGIYFVTAIAAVVFTTILLA